ncbi:MAG: ADP-forming succinate--CoA ligase subunit beta [Alphaproteobacteria bacterium]|nr:ADP-forming succinate--CoA ligase subunit beta [Alphaproteobacteria bacterium]
MNIHEYQAKALLGQFGVTVLPGFVAYTVTEAEEAARKLGGNVWVVKAQIHAGGRGKAGGVKLARSLDQVRDLSKEILGKTLVTPQTGPAGKVVKRLYIESGCDIQKEFYLSALVDRQTSKIMFLASSEGGVDIEEVAEKHPDKIVKIAVDPATGFMPYQARYVAFKLGLANTNLAAAVKFLSGIYEALMKLDASAIEINPLVLTKQGDLIALDAKMNFDDNALYRHADILKLRDEDEEDQAEIEASKYGLNYIKLDGNIGCMVNGAGLAMATMDIIKLYGGDPANFLDVGGGATKERVTQAFKLILSDPKVEGILINIFGGIMRCDVIAEGVVSAAKEISIHVPLVVRLEGTNVELGKKILQESGLKIISASNLATAAQNIVQAVREVQ